MRLAELQILFTDISQYEVLAKPFVIPIKILQQACLAHIETDLLGVRLSDRELRKMR